jgi:hypothetical protein
MFFRGGALEVLFRQPYNFSALCCIRSIRGLNIRGKLYNAKEERMNIRKMLGFTIICLAVSSLALAQPQGGPPGEGAAGAARIEISGAYEAVLPLPAATPTVLLTFCPGGDPFQGAWLEEGGNKFVGEMTDKKVDGETFYFTVQAGPGKWDFKCTIEGDTLKGTVTGDYATSPFEGKRVELEVADYCSKKFEADKTATANPAAGGQGGGPGGPPGDAPAGGPPGAAATESAPVDIAGAYEAVLTLPKASPTAILTFCSGGDPFQGAWLEEGGNKYVNEMTDKKVDGNTFYFTIQAGPGKWDFKCSLEGNTLKGTVTGDYATSSFEGKPVKLDVEDYCSKKFEADKKAAANSAGSGQGGGPGGGQGGGPGGGPPPGAPQ